MEIENGRACFCALLSVAIKTKRARRDGPADLGTTSVPALVGSHLTALFPRTPRRSAGSAGQRWRCPPSERGCLFGKTLPQGLRTPAHRLAVPAEPRMQPLRAFTLQSAAASKDAFRASALTDAPSSPRQCQGARMLVIHPQMKKRNHLCYDSNHDRQDIQTVDCRAGSI